MESEDFPFVLWCTIGADSVAATQNNSETSHTPPEYEYQTILPCCANCSHFDLEGHCKKYNVHADYVGVCRDFE